MMRSFFLIIFFLLMSVRISAVPADGVQRMYSQPDGSIISLRQYGDEHVHFMLTSDGMIVREGDDGGFYYALIENGILHPSKMLAHDNHNRNTTEKNFVTLRRQNKYDDQMLQLLRDNHREHLAVANVNRLARTQRALGIPNIYTGKKKGLVILVEFANLQMRSEEANYDFQRMFNERGYKDNNHIGSVHDYFFDQSYGVFDLTFDVVGPVVVSKNYGYYGSDSMNGYNDMNVREMIVEACQLANEFVDYNDYDWDQDGTVDQVFIIYAGYGQATGGSANTIWPHESYLTEEIDVDGVKISQYACSNELYMGNSSKYDKLMGIGTACHEFSHCLGLPDLYDTNYSGAYGMGYWDVMNSGSYNGPDGVGEVPCGYSAFERWFAGWLEFVDIDTSQKIFLMPSLEKSPKAYRLINDGHKDEYYTIENRQPDKWFKYVGQYEDPHGMLVTHIDYDLKAWATNKVNPNPTRQRMSPVVADNNYGRSYNNIIGDLFPGSTNQRELTNTSHTEFGGKLYNKNVDGSYHMNKSILNISEVEGYIFFDVIFQNELPTPVAGDAEDVTERSFKAVWTPVGQADRYTLELEIIRNTKPFLMETILIEDITDPVCQVDDLEAEYCNYRVRAHRGNLHTEWSNQVMVKLQEISGISSVKMVSDNDNTQLYSLTGVKLSTPRQAGIYIKGGKKIIYK